MKNKNAQFSYKNWKYDIFHKQIQCWIQNQINININSIKSNKSSSQNWFLELENTKKNIWKIKPHNFHAKTENTLFSTDKFSIEFSQNYIRNHQTKITSQFLLHTKYLMNQLARYPYFSWLNTHACVAWQSNSDLCVLISVFQISATNFIYNE